MRENKLKNLLAYSAATLIVAASLTLSTKSFLAIILNGDIPGGKRYDIAYFNNRFAPFKGRVPADEPVAYFSDIASSAEQAPRFGYARLILAPVKLVFEKTAKNNIAVTDFTSGANIKDFADKHGYSIEREFGEGRAILKKKEPPAPAR